MLRVDGTLPDVKFSGLFSLKNGSLLRDNLEIRNFSLDIPLEGTKSFFNISPLKGTLESFSFSQGDNKIDFKQIKFDGKVGCHVDDRKVDFHLLEFQIPPLSPLEIKARMDLQRLFFQKKFQIVSSMVARKLNWKSKIRSMLMMNGIFRAL